MTNYTTPIDECISTAYNIYYIDEYKPFCELLDTDTPTRDELADALTEDIRDLLHNGNLLELFPDAADLTDEGQEALSDRFHNDYDELGRLANGIADLMIAAQTTTKEN